MRPSRRAGSRAQVAAAALALCAACGGGSAEVQNGSILIETVDPAGLVLDDAEGNRSPRIELGAGDLPLVLASATLDPGRAVLKIDDDSGTRLAVLDVGGPELLSVPLEAELAEAAAAGPTSITHEAWGRRFVSSLARRRMPPLSSG
jgi:hypothetical protein